MAKVRKRTWQSGNETKTCWLVDYTDSSGKRHQIAKRTKKEADAWLYKVQYEISRGIHTPSSSSITIGEAGALWLQQAETDGLERSTIMQYNQHLKYHICPFIGTIKLASFGPVQLASFRNKLLAEGRSRAMLSGVSTSLGAILGYAVAHALVGRNVVRDAPQARRGASASRHKRQLEVGVDVPTKDEIRAMLQHAQGRWRPLIIVAVFSGLRASELRGLRWSDVDLEKSILHVRQRADRFNMIGSPKSAAGKRSVPLAPIAVNVLREWKLACPRGVLDLVFPNSKGKVDSLPNIHRRGLGTVQVAAGIKKPYGMHALRHAAASLFIEQGFSPKRIQAMMGHSSITMTFDTYGHLFPSPDDDQVSMRQLQARLIG
jgi:integrase